MVRSKLLPALAGLAALWGLVGPAQATDGMSVFPDASRISIGGAVTEIVYALGEAKPARGARLDQPLSGRGADASGRRLHARAVAGGRAPSVNPTGLLVVAGSGPKEALDVLKKASVAYIEVPDS